MITFLGNFEVTPKEAEEISMFAFQQKKNAKKFVPWFILFLIAVNEMATSIYAPSLPKISDIFQISEALTELTISINIIAFALSGLLYGPLSDSYGRRPLLIVGMTLFLIGSLFCFLSQDYTSFMASRFLQGCGQGVALVVGLTSIKDLFKGQEAAKLFALLGLVISLSPGVAPLIGGHLATHYPWWSSFLLITVFASLSWILLVILYPETLPLEGRPSFSGHKMLKSYAQLFKNKDYLTHAGARVLTMAWFWGEMTNLPLVYVDGMGLSPQEYGFFWGGGMVVYALSNLTLQKVLNIWDLQRVRRTGLLLCFVFSILQALAYFIAGDNLPIWFLHGLKFPTIFGLAYIVSASTTLALEASDKNAGAGSALIFALQMGLGAVIVFLEGLFYNGTLLPILFSTVLLALAALIQGWGEVLQERNNDESRA